MLHLIREWGFWYGMVRDGSISSWGILNGWNNMFWCLLVIILCLGMCELRFGLVLVLLVHEQWRNSTSFARASLSRLGESCRSSFRVLVWVFRSGDQVRSWAKRSLTQARLARLSEVARKPGRFERDFSPRRGVLECWATYTLTWARMDRLSEVAMRLDFFLLNPRPGEEICVLNDLGSRLGEKSSPKRDEVVQPLLHARSSDLG